MDDKQNNTSSKGFSNEDSRLSSQLKPFLLKEPPQVKQQQTATITLEDIYTAQEKESLRDTQFRKYLRAYHVNHLRKLDNIGKLLSTTLLNDKKATLQEKNFQNSLKDTLKKTQEFQRPSKLSRTLARGSQSLVQGSLDTLLPFLPRGISGKLSTEVGKAVSSGLSKLTTGTSMRGLSSLLMATLRNPYVLGAGALGLGGFGAYKMLQGGHTQARVSPVAQESGWDKFINFIKKLQGKDVAPKLSNTPYTSIQGSSKGIWDAENERIAKGISAYKFSNIPYTPVTRGGSTYSPVTARTPLLSSVGGIVSGIATRDYTKILGTPLANAGMRKIQGGLTKAGVPAPIAGAVTNPAALSTTIYGVMSGVKDPLKLVNTQAFQSIVRKISAKNKYLSTSTINLLLESVIRQDPTILLDPVAIERVIQDIASAKQPTSPTPVATPVATTPKQTPIKVTHPKSTSAPSISRGALGASESYIQGLKNREGFKSRVYKDIGGVTTIGYGRTSGSMAPTTKKQEEAFLRKRINNDEYILNKHLKRPISQGQYDATLDLMYQAGSSAVINSEYFRKLNAGDYAGAEKELQRWVYYKDKSTGKMVTSGGMRNRSNARLKMFKANGSGIDYMLSGGKSGNVGATEPSMYDKALEQMKKHQKEVSAAQTISQVSPTPTSTMVTPQAPVIISSNIGTSKEKISGLFIPPTYIESIAENIQC